MLSITLFPILIGSDESLVLLKIDVKDTFNECNRTAFPEHVSEDFYGLPPWAELWFGHRHILASIGVNRGSSRSLTT